MIHHRFVASTWKRQNHRIPGWNSAGINLVVFRPEYSGRMNVVMTSVTMARHGYIRNCFQNLKCNNFRPHGTRTKKRKAHRTKTSMVDSLPCLLHLPRLWRVLQEASRLVQDLDAEIASDFKSNPLSIWNCSIRIAAMSAAISAHILHTFRGNLVAILLALRDFKLQFYCDFKFKLLRLRYCNLGI